MNVLILGSGHIGPAAAYFLLDSAQVSTVILADLEQVKLDHAVNKITRTRKTEKLQTLIADAISLPPDLIKDTDLIISAVPRSISHLAITEALRHEIPLVELTLPLAKEMSKLQEDLKHSGVPCVIGAGLEPGLTEIMARKAALDLDQIDQLHIKCGGIPEKPEPPLDYKIVFGGTSLPLSEAPASMVKDGSLIQVERYSGIEELSFPDVGKCEAHFEMFMPWLIEYPEFNHLKNGTQKTIRWPGFAEKAAILRELGLLSTKPVLVGSSEIIPKQMLDQLLFPLVKLDEGERDITLLRVEVSGVRSGQPVTHTVEMCDRGDLSSGFTSMARTVGFTGAAIAEMIICGDINQTGLVRPEAVIVGPLLDQLLSRLEKENIKFELNFG